MSVIVCMIMPFVGMCVTCMLTLTVIRLFFCISNAQRIPISGNKVKEERKIYVTLNPSGFRKVLVPDLTQRTLRQAQPALEALGFKVGKTTYVDNIAKDVVLSLQFKGKSIAPNKRLPKTTVIDLVLGNGKRPGNLSTTETP